MTSPITNAAPSVSAQESKPVACPIKLPVSVDEINAECGHGPYHAYALFDADDRAICDTLNCDSRVTRLEEEYDEDSHRMWDEQSRLNMEAIAKALNAAQSVSAQDASPKCGWSANDDGFYETSCGKTFVTSDGTAEENGFKFCCFCGKTLTAPEPPK